MTDSATMETTTAAATRRVVLADPISPEGVRLLEDAGTLEVDDRAGVPREVLKEALAEAAALIVRSSTTVDRDLLEAADALQVIGRAGVGVDNIDVQEATRRGIAVLNAPGGNTLSTAELAFGLLLAAARRIPAAERSLRDGRWDRKAFRGVQLHGKRLGVVGAGRIGSEVVARAHAFGMDVAVHDPYLPRERAEDMGVELLELEALLERSDFVTLHAPLTDQTAGMIGDAELALMPEGAVLVNAARGGLVDEEALARALEDGHLGGAAVDVYQDEPLPDDHPLRTAPDVVMTPHLGAATDAAKRGVAVEIAEAVRDALLQGDLRAALNAPRIDPARRHQVAPILQLGRWLGRLAAELAPGRCGELRVRYGGPHEEILRPLAASVAEGYLSPTTDRQLNRVNSLVLAGERGIEVQRARMGDAGDYANYVEVTSERGDGELVVGGALLGEGHPRIVRIGDFHVDAVPRERMVVIRNRDVPGVIGEVGSRLGDAGVNIAEYHQSRRDAGGDALAVVTVDAPAPEEVLAEIRGLEAVQSVQQVSLVG
jgi:D-3-phosphoglycerate dehydrogenase